MISCVHILTCLILSEKKSILRSWFICWAIVLANITIPRHQQYITCSYSSWWLRFFLKNFFLILGFFCLVSEFLWLALLWFSFMSTLDRYYYSFFHIFWYAVVLWFHWSGQGWRDKPINLINNGAFGINNPLPFEMDCTINW